MAIVLAAALVCGCGAQKKPEGKAAKPGGQPAIEKGKEKAHPAEKPEVKPVEKPEVKPAEKPEPKPAEKPEVKPAEKPEMKPAEKPEVKPVEKPQPKPAEKPEPKPVEKPESKPAEKPEVKPAEKPEPKPAEKPETKPGEKPESKPAEKPKPKPAEKPEVKPAEKPAAKGASDLKKGALDDVPAVVWLPKPPVNIPQAQAKTEAEMKAYTEAIPATDVKFDMVPIKGGKFLMGSPETEEGRWLKDEEGKPVKDNSGKKISNEGPQHEVQVAPFWMGKCEVTWDEYELWGLHLDSERREMRKIVATAQDKLADVITWPTRPYTDMTFGMGKEGYPAVCMTQLAARSYCKWLSAKTGRYYRLPTEAEWEYACRAGRRTAYSFGDDPEKLGDYAWYYENSEEKYHKVGKKKPNPWGLYDMHGNVCEWVLDAMDPGYYKACAGKLLINPFNPPKTEFGRCVRGGSWDDDAEGLRSAARRPSTKLWKLQDPQIPQSIWYLTDATFVGFRVVRPLALPSATEAKQYDPDVKVIREYAEAQGDKQ